MGTSYSRPETQVVLPVPQWLYPIKEYKNPYDIKAPTTGLDSLSDIMPHVKLTISDLFRGVSFKVNVRNAYNKDAPEWICCAKLDLVKGILYICKSEGESMNVKKYTAYAYYMSSWQRIGGDNGQVQMSEQHTGDQDYDNRFLMPDYKFVDSGITFSTNFDFYRQVFRVLRTIVDESGLIENLIHKKSLSEKNIETHLITFLHEGI